MTIAIRCRGGRILGRAPETHQRSAGTREIAFVAGVTAGSYRMKPEERNFSGLHARKRERERDLSRNGTFLVALYFQERPREAKESRKR
jgi:hypothetical protein